MTFGILNNIQSCNNLVTIWAFDIFQVWEFLGVEKTMTDATLTDVNLFLAQENEKKCQNSFFTIFFP